MLSLVYSLSSDLKNTLSTADALRVRILATPIPLKTELKIRWEMTIQHVYSSLALAGGTLNKSEIIKLLSDHPKKLNAEEQEAANYKQTLDAIYFDWRGSAKPVSVSAVSEIIRMFTKNNKESLQEFIPSESIVKQLLEYLESQGDHPLVQAAIIHYQLIANPVIRNDRGRIARLLSILFLSKFGYDVRGLIAPEREWRSTEESYRRAIQTSAVHGQMTPFIEYVVNAYVVSLEQTVNDIAGTRFHTETKASFLELTDRQRQILTYLENPQTIITNRKVQKMCGVSQITASRDLAKLVALSLIFARGKGRSVYYMRAV